MEDKTRDHTAVLATDLDGTFIPLCGDEQNRRDLKILVDLLAAHHIPLVYVTGRHFESVQQAITDFDLPRPDWMICDVGTSILKRQPSEEYVLVEPYQRYQDDMIRDMPIDSLQRQLLEFEGLRSQEAEKQGRFKLSYYVNADRLDVLALQLQRLLADANAPYSLIPSVDPFTGDGLIDFLPQGVSKAHALHWWSQHVGLDASAIIFAGDSGNDLAALTAGYRAIVVGNAGRALARQVQQMHEQAGWNGRLYLARKTATSGVLEGCRQFGFPDADD